MNMPVFNLTLHRKIWLYISDNPNIKEQCLKEMLEKEIIGKKDFDFIYRNDQLCLGCQYAEDMAKFIEINNLYEFRKKSLCDYCPFDVNNKSGCLGSLYPRWESLILQIDDNPTYWNMAKIYATLIANLSIKIGTRFK